MDTINISNPQQPNKPQQPAANQQQGRPLPPPPSRPAPGVPGPQNRPAPQRPVSSNDTAKKAGIAAAAAGVAGVATAATMSALDNDPEVATTAVEDAVNAGQNAGTAVPPAQPEEEQTPAQPGNNGGGNGNGGGSNNGGGNAGGGNNNGGSNNGGGNSNGGGNANGGESNNGGGNNGGGNNGGAGEEIPDPEIPDPEIDPELDPEIDPESEVEVDPETGLVVDPEDVTIDDPEVIADPVDVDELTDTLIAEEQIDVQDIDTDDVFTFNDIETVYTVEGDELTLASMTTDTGYDVMMVDIDNDGLFDLITDDQGNILDDASQFGLTVSDAENMIQGEGYMAQSDSEIEHFDDTLGDDYLDDIINV